MIDAVAQRYGVLPTVLLSSGSSVDIMIATTAQSYAARKQAEAEGKPLPKRKPVLTEKEMMAMVERAKARK